MNSQNQYTRRGYVPDPDKHGWFKYDKEEYIKIIQQEAQKRIEVMIEIINSRGARYDLTDGIRKTQKYKAERRGRN